MFLIPLLSVVFDLHILSNTTNAEIMQMSVNVHRVLIIYDGN